MFWLKASLFLHLSDKGMLAVYPLSHPALLGVQHILIIFWAPDTRRWSNSQLNHDFEGIRIHSRNPINISSMR